MPKDSTIVPVVKNSLPAIAKVDARPNRWKGDQICIQGCVKQKHSEMGVSLNGGTPKAPQNDHFK